MGLGSSWRRADTSNDGQYPCAGRSASNDSLQLCRWLQHTEMYFKKYGLECTAACGSCQDGNCENMNNAPIVDENED